LYRITADYHTHTRFSHGKGTIEENVEAARRRGLKKIVISDHGFRHIGIGMSVRDIDKIRYEIERVSSKYKDIEVLMGVEANLIGIDGTIDIPWQYIKDFDIILMGFHKAVYPASIRDGWRLFFQNGLAAVFPKNREKLRRQNTEAMINAIERYPIRIITHPGAKIDIDTQMLAKYAAQKNVALEINSSHGFMTVEYVKIAMKEGAPFVINSDAHHPSKVGIFDKGIEIAKKAGLRPEQIINAET
jgi:putative hydrolase